MQVRAEHAGEVAAALPARRRTALGLLWLLATLALTACGGGTSAAPAATWSVVGSSSVVGVGASPGHGWSDLLAADLQGRGVTLRKFAKSGSDTYAALPLATAPVANRPAPDPDLSIDTVLAVRPAVLIISFPSNDTAKGYSAGETVTNLLQLRQFATAAGAGVIVVSTFPRNLSAAGLDTLHEIDRQMGAATGPCFADVHAALASAAGDIAVAYAAGDGVHLNDAGHRLVFERVRALVDSGLCVRPGAG
jgi:acyl-CoA thioesterase I